MKKNTSKKVSISESDTIPKIASKMYSTRCAAKTLRNSHFEHRNVFEERLGDGDEVRLKEERRNEIKSRRC